MRLAILIAGLMLLAGCAVFPPAAIVNGASLVGSEKTVGDHIMSYVSGKDCSTVRSNLGRTYCVEDEPNPIPRVFCYPTIGKVTCYDRPDPRRQPYEKVGRNDHNLDLAR
jgi:hypothetical protein